MHIVTHSPIAAHCVCAHDIGQRHLQVCGSFIDAAHTRNQFLNCIPSSFFRSVPQTRSLQLDLIPLGRSYQNATQSTPHRHTSTAARRTRASAALHDARAPSPPPPNRQGGPLRRPSHLQQQRAHLRAWRIPRWWRCRSVRSSAGVHVCVYACRSHCFLPTPTASTRRSACARSRCEPSHGVAVGRKCASLTLCPLRETAARGY